MSRIRRPMKQLQLVELSYEISDPRSGWADTTWRRSPLPGPSSSVPESRPVLRCSPPFETGASVGYRSLNTPFGSSEVH